MARQPGAARVEELELGPLGGAGGELLLPPAPARGGADPGAGLPVGTGAGMAAEGGARPAPVKRLAAARGSSADGGDDSASRSFQSVALDAEAAPAPAPAPATRAKSSLSSELLLVSRQMRLQLLAAGVYSFLSTSKNVVFFPFIRTTIECVSSIPAANQHSGEWSGSDHCTDLSQVARDAQFVKGLAEGLDQAAHCLVLPLLGHLLDVLGRRFGMLLGMLGVLLQCLCFAWAASGSGSGPFTLLVVGSVLQGLTGVFMAAINASVRDVQLRDAAYRSARIADGLSENGEEEEEEEHEHELEEELSGAGGALALEDRRAATAAGAGAGSGSGTGASAGAGAAGPGAAANHCDLAVPVPSSRRAAGKGKPHDSHAYGAIQVVQSLFSAVGMFLMVGAVVAHNMSSYVGVWLGLSGLCGVTLLVLWLAFPETRRQPAPFSWRKASPSIVLELFWAGGAKRWVALSLFFALLSISSLTMLQAYTVSQYHWTQTYSTVVFTSLSPIMVSSMLAAFTLIPRYGPLAVLRGGLAVLNCGMLALCFSQTSEVFVFVGMGFLFMSLVALPAVMQVITALSEDNEVGELLGNMGAVMLAAVALGNVLYGTVFRQAQDWPGLSFLIAFPIMLLSTYCAATARVHVEPLIRL